MAEQSDVNTANEFLLSYQDRRIAPIMFPVLSTQQEAYRHAAWIVAMAEILPEEEPVHTFEEILEAVRNT